MTSQMLCRPLAALAGRSVHRVAPMMPAAAVAAVCCPAAAVRAIHSSALLRAEPAKGPKVAGAAGKKKKEVVAAGPMKVPAAMSEYSFAHLSVLKEYKAPAEKVVAQPDAAYPAWIWDQTPEPTWSDLLLADFETLPPTYQKKVFSMPRKIQIKKNNDLTRKA